MDSKEVITAKAIEFAEKYLEAAKNGKVDLLPVEQEWLDSGDDNFVYKYAQKFAADLRSNGYDKADEAKLKRLSEFKPADGVTWLLFNGADPETKFESDQFKKFQPLVENGKWMQMDKRALQDWANKHDYDMSDKESADRFWNDLQRHDVNYNKAKTVDDFSKSGAGIALALGAPSAYEEGVKQALTDDPMSSGKVWGQFANDAGTNLVMAALGSKFASSPLAAGGLQAGAEAGRQGIKKAIDPELEFQGTPIAATFGAGATVPSMVRGLVGWTRQSTNPRIANFGKSMLRGAKGYDESVDELNAIKQTLIKARHPREVKEGVAGPVKYENDTATKKARNMLQNLGFNDGDAPTFESLFEEVMNPANRGKSPSIAHAKYNHLMNNPTGQEYSVERMLSPDISDKEALRVLEDAYNGDYGKNLVDLNTADEPTLQYVLKNLANSKPKEADKVVAQSMDNQTNVIEGLQTLPARYARLAEGDVPATNPVIRALVGDIGRAESKGGYAVGKVLGGVGGSLEPAFKVNPYSMVTDIATTGNASQGLKAKTTDYQQQDWYKKLRTRNPQMADAIDAAFKAKE
jgi:hypothetical protein